MLVDFITFGHSQGNCFPLLPVFIMDVLLRHGYNGATAQGHLELQTGSVLILCIMDFLSIFAKLSLNREKQFKLSLCLWAK